MRTHADIIRDANGPHAVARLLGTVIEADAATLESRARAWNLNKSIPGEYWPLIASLGLATLAELAAAAAARKGIPANDPTPHSEAA